MFCPVKRISVTEIWKKMVLILFLRKVGIFRIYVSYFNIMMHPFEFVFSTNRIIYFVEVSLFI